MDGYAVGVAEEFLLVDAASGELRGHAEAVLQSDWAAPLVFEIGAVPLKVATHACPTTQGVADEIRRVRLGIARAARRAGLALIAAGLHPYAGTAPEGEDDPHWARIYRQYGRALPMECLCGTRIHVEVPEKVDRVRILTRLRDFAPHFLALSASSPLHNGKDLGYASTRRVLWRRLPHTGVPPALASESEYDTFVHRLLHSGAISDLGGVTWSVRLHPLQHALEVLVPDCCIHLADAVALAGLARTLIVAIAEEALASHPAAPLESAWETALQSNEWQAARFGLDAVLLCRERESGLDLMRDALRRLVDGVGPLARQLGDDAALQHVEELLRQGNGADGIRRTLLSQANGAGLVRWLAAESLRGVGLEVSTAYRAPLS